MKRITIIANHLAEPLVTVKKPADKIALVTLNRPTKLNALNNDLWRELNAILNGLESRSDIHVIILTGAGKAFCVGADVTIFDGLKPGHVAQKNPIESWFEVLQNIKKPVIAAVNGLALGGGCEIAMMCDIIIADKHAKFSQPEIKLALIPGAGGTQRLTRTIGKYKAMEMMLCGEMINAEDARMMGLVSKIAEKSAVEDAMAMAKKIAGYSLPAVLLCKRAIKASMETGLSTGLTQELSLFNNALTLNDKVEGIAALLEKRPPKFTNS
jgi:enoyl-CoA hydratase/carnithine racemase